MPADPKKYRISWSWLHSFQHLVCFSPGCNRWSAKIPRRLLTVVCEAQLKIIDTGAAACSFVNSVDEFNGHVMKARKFQHGRTTARRGSGGGGWEKGKRREEESRNRGKEERGGGEERDNYSPVSSHLHSIPDGWAKSQLHFCARPEQGYYLNNSLLSKGKRREGLLDLLVMYSREKGPPRPFAVHTVLKQSMQ